MDFDLQTIAEWRQLGFYYDYNKDLSQWQLFGSKAGLKLFVNYIESYIDNPQNSIISEHMHLGPYNYLKIMTWHTAEISSNWIAGTISQLRILSQTIDEKLLQRKIGDHFLIGKDYSHNSIDTILFTIMPDNFDPASLDVPNNPTNP